MADTHRQTSVLTTSVDTLSRSEAVQSGGDQADRDPRETLLPDETRDAFSLRAARSRHVLQSWDPWLKNRVEGHQLPMEREEVLNGVIDLLVRAFSSSSSSSSSTLLRYCDPLRIAPFPIMGVASLTVIHARWVTPGDRLEHKQEKKQTQRIFQPLFARDCAPTAGVARAPGSRKWGEKESSRASMRTCFFELWTSLCNVLSLSKDSWIPLVSGKTYFVPRYMWTYWRSDSLLSSLTW